MLQEEGDLKFDEFVHNDIKVSKVVVFQGAKMKKKPGLYFNIQTPSLPTSDKDLIRDTQEVVKMYLSQMLDTIKITEQSTCLVVGLGNREVTADSLGPLVADEILVTSHIFRLEPENIGDGFRPVSSLVPGVMGNTGIETHEIINSVVKSIKPDFVIVIDALASSSVNRVNRTIQITDAGISPGSGVGNKRKEISFESIGVPVIAIGVPTVVDASTIVSNTIDMMLKYLKKEIDSPSNPLIVNGQKAIDYLSLDEPNDEEKKKYLGVIGSLTDEEKYQLAFEVLTPAGLNLIVTPKEIDETIINFTRIISNAINCCLHKALQN